MRANETRDLLIMRPLYEFGTKIVHNKTGLLLCINLSNFLHTSYNDYQPLLCRQS
jgi:hypothetical protein